MKIAAQYQSGISTYELAKCWGINRQTVTSAIARAGIPIRKVNLTDSRLREAYELNSQGWSLNRLGKKYGMDPKTMKKLLAEV